MTPLELMYCISACFYRYRHRLRPRGPPSRRQTVMRRKWTIILAPENPLAPFRGLYPVDSFIHKLRPRMLAFCSSTSEQQTPEAVAATMEDVTTPMKSSGHSGADPPSSGGPSASILRDGAAAARPSRLGRLFCYTRPPPAVATPHMPVDDSGRANDGGRSIPKRHGGFPPATTWGVHPRRSMREGVLDDADGWPHNGWWTLPDGAPAHDAASRRPCVAALTAAGIPDPTQGVL